MKLFKCQNCGQMLYFENGWCESCGRRLGYLPDIGLLSSVVEDGASWIAAANPDFRYRFCANWEAYACNWMVPAKGQQAFCIACQHNRKIPDISDPENHRLWQKLEDAKRRLFYSLIKLRLPMPTDASGDSEPLAFQFLGETDEKPGQKVMTGHDNGVITISLAEADDAEREKTRTQMGEPYRTLLGHFRHEVGHHYWDTLVRDGGRLEECRAVFGDDAQDYAQALERHYHEGPPADWQKSFVSAYATAHPWEDFAETWAHYLHIVDTLEMASAFGIRIEPAIDPTGDYAAWLDVDPYGSGSMPELIELWTPFVVAMNCIGPTAWSHLGSPVALPPSAAGTATVPFVPSSAGPRIGGTTSPLASRLPSPLRPWSDSMRPRAAMPHQARRQPVASADNAARW